MFKNTPALAGFVAGALACLLLAAAINVIFNGQGLGDFAPQSEVVYPNW